ncbi:6617_t:CDS:2 [Acaulospora colombiana]|uniref:6617_t:CDS:1 n=1 Tax=Acaulospora colombiana TaxID=27376 RepID=A0ACA9KRH8_9GLOM|nr:6617_t:CDS:2 [Acaulospora colombiana]
MPRHSKNNTALSFFTYAEGKALEYGTKKQRLGRESMREYDACFLCLQRARDPVCCTQGHLFCRECILENILAQKKEIKRQQLILESRVKDEAEEAKRKEELAKEAVIQDFERQQVRIAPFGPSGSSNDVQKTSDNNKSLELIRSDSRSARSNKGAESSQTGKKRSFQLDEEEIAAIAERDVEEASKKLEEERLAATKPKLPNFWLPSLTSSADPDKIKSVKLQTMCTCKKLDSNKIYRG